MNPSIQSCCWLLLAAGAALASEAQAGSWMRSGGEYRYAAALEYSTADAYYDRSGDRQSMGCTSGNVYHTQSLEYGYSYYHTLFGDLSAAAKNCGGESNSGVGDLKVGVRGRLDIFRNGRTWEAALIIPTGYSRDAPSRLGYGRFGAELGAYARFPGDEAVPRRGFDWEVGAAVRVWDGPPSDQYLLETKVSRDFGRLRGAFALAGDFSFYNGRPEQIQFVNQTRLDEYEKITAALSLTDRLRGKWQLEYRLSDVVWGRNVGDSLTFGITLSRAWME